MLQYVGIQFWNILYANEHILITDTSRVQFEIARQVVFIMSYDGVNVRQICDDDGADDDLTIVFLLTRTQEIDGLLNMCTHA